MPSASRIPQATTIVISALQGKPSARFTRKLSKPSNGQVS